MSNKFMDALGGPKSDYRDGINDAWSFQRDPEGDWRWSRTATNGEICGAAHEGYRNLADCEANARRHGWNGVTGKVRDDE